MSISGELVTVGVDEGFRRWAEVYDETPNPLLSLEERLLEPMLADLRGRTVVDIGCGTGRWLSRLHRRGAYAIGIDRSAAMLEKAGKKLDLSASLFCADSCAIPLRNRIADLVLCSFTLGYIGDIAAFAKELKCVARPGGEIVISDFHPEAHRRGWRRSFRSGAQTVEVENFQHSINDLAESFRTAGFILDEILEASFGEPERALFVVAGKEHLFTQATEAPAIFVARFRLPRTRSSSVRPQPSTRFVIRGARVAEDAQTARVAELHIHDDRVAARGSTMDAPVDFDGYLLLPGLINAHDHLEFNLFPRLGHGTYDNFLDWAADIQQRDEVKITQHRALPKTQRLLWGAIKNVLSGVTTVAHHNPYEPNVFENDFPVRVLRDFGWAHSLALEPEIEKAFAAAVPDAPFIVHLSEGTDSRAAAELEELDDRGMLRPHTVVVHGVALSPEQRRLLRERGAALVWCPSSNLFTLGKTCSASELGECGRLALGTDSALTGQGSLLDEISVARKLDVPSVRLYELVTTSAADVLQLRAGQGTLTSGAIADVIAVHDRGLSPAETLATLSDKDIELVVVGGRVRMISPDLERLWPMALPKLEALTVNGVRRLVAAPIGDMFATARQQLGPDIRLAHKRVTA